MKTRTRRIIATLTITLTVLVAALAFLDGARLVTPPRTIVLQYDREVVLMETPTGDHFARAGLRGGDAIVGLDGVPFTDRMDFNRRMRAERPGNRITFDVRRGTGQLALPVTLDRNLGPLEWLGLGVPVVVLILAGSVVFLTRPHLPGASLLLLASLAPATLAAQKATGFAIGGAASLITLAVLLFGVFNGALTAHFFLSFPERGTVQRRLLPLVWIAYAVAAAVSARLLLPELVPATRAVVPGLVGTHRLILLYEYSVGLCVVLSAISAAATARRASTPRGRAQGRVLCAGALLAAGSFLLFWVVPRTTGHLAPLGPVGLCWLMLIMPVSVFVAIVFHRLFEIDVLSRQRRVYVTLSVLIAGLFVLGAAAAGALLEPYVAAAGLAWLAAIAAFVAIALHPLRNWANNLVDRVLYRKRYDYRPALTEIAGRLAGLIDPMEAVLYVRLQLDRLLGPVWVDVVERRGDQFERIDEAGSATVYAAGAPARRVLALLESSVTAFEPDPEEWGADRTGDGEWPRRPALVAAMHSGDAIVGAVAIGPRRVDVAYRLEDVDFLQTLASITGSVLERGRLVNERSQRERLALVGSATAAVVHELKNPLAGIKSAVAILRRRLGGEPRSDELAGIVESEIDRLQDTILNVLTYVRPQSSPAVAVSLGDTLRPLVAVVDADFRAAGVEVVMTTTHAESLVAGDPGHLRQMVLNLLLNAREAMPSGGRIEVTIEPWMREGEVLGVDVVVRDYGPGFGPESLRRATEPFFSTKRLGTGLGLANVKRLVEEYDGELVIANRPEGGAEVRLRLRAASVGVGRVRNGRPGR